MEITIKDLGQFATKSTGFQKLTRMFISNQISFENMEKLFIFISNQTSIPDGEMDEFQQSSKVLEFAIDYFKEMTAGIFPKVIWCKCKKHGYILMTKPTGFDVEKVQILTQVIISLNLNGEKSDEFYSKTSGIIMTNNLLINKKITIEDFERISQEIESNKDLETTSADTKKYLN